VSKTESEKKNIADPNATHERLIAEHGIYNAQTPNLDETLGVSPSEKEAMKRLNENMRKFMTDFTTHGKWGKKDPKTGKKILEFRSDLDGEACLALFRKAGFRTNKAKYVEQGEKSKSGWIVDTGEIEGYEIGDSGMILIVDHHAKHSKRDTSATKHLYEGLAKFGLLEKNEGLDNFVEFVTKEDNKDYSPDELEKLVRNYEGNLAGLKSYLGEDQLIEIFEEAGKQRRELDPYGRLPDKFLENLRYKNPLSKRDEQYHIVNKRLAMERDSSLDGVDDLARRGFVVDTGKGLYGKVLINTAVKGKEGGRRIALKSDAAFFKGYGAYVEWYPESNFYIIQTNSDIKFDLGEGFNSRGRYILRSSDEGEMKHTLGGILEKMANKPDFEAGKAVKKIMDQEIKKSAKTEGQTEKAAEREISERDFTPEDWEKVKELAYFIYEHRMAGVNMSDKEARERQKKAAREYGLDEKIFLKESIEDIELPSGKKIRDIAWTPEAQKFMQDWDWARAIEIYKNKKDEWHGKKDKEAAKPEPEAVPPTSPEPEAVPPTSPEPETSPNSPEASEEMAEKREGDSQASEKFRLLSEAREKYANIFGKAFTDRKWYQRILGVNVEKFDEVKQAREAYQKALDEYIKDERESILSDLKSGKINAQEAGTKSKKFAQLIKCSEIVTLAERKQQEAERQSEERGLIITKLSARWNEMIGKWRKLPWPVKLGASAVALGIGGGYAVVGVGITRILNGAIFGKAAQEYLQTGAEGWRKDKRDATLGQIDKQIESKFGEAEDRVKRAFAILEMDNAVLGERLTKQAGGDNWRRRIGIFAGVVAGSGLLAKAVGWGYEHSSGKPSLGAVVPEGSGKGVVSAEIMENRPHGQVINQYETAGKRPAWLEALDDRQRLAQEKFHSAAAASDRAHEALAQSRGELAAARVAETAAIDNVQTHKWMDFIQSKIYGPGTGVDWHEPANEFRKRMMGSFLTSDQPMGPPINFDEQQQFWRAAQELNSKLGPALGNESTESWLQRGLAQGKVSPEEIIGTLKRVVNK